jgi:hypothetical protein
MQLSGTFPQLSDGSKKSIRQQIKLQSAAGKQKGGVIGGGVRKHTGTTAGNRDRARARARGKG